MATTQAEIDLIARDKSGPAFREAIKNANALTDNVTKSHRRVAAESTTAFGRVQEGIEKAHRSLESFGSLIGIAIGAETLREGIVLYADMDTAIRRLGFSSGKTREEVTSAFEKIDDVAKRTGVSAEELRKSFRDLTSAEGWEKATRDIERISTVSKGTGASLADSTKAIISLRQHFELTEEQIPKALDAIAEAARHGKIEGDDLTRSIGQWGANLAELGEKGPEGLIKSVAVMEAMSKGTTNATEALAAMGELINHITSRGRAAPSLLLELLGLGPKTLEADLNQASRNNQNLIAVYVHDIERAINFYAERNRMDPGKDRLAILNRIFPGKADFNRAMDALIGNLGEVKRTVDAIKLGGTGPGMDEQAKKMVDGTQAQLDRLAVQWKHTQEILGGGLVSAGALEEFNKGIEKTFDIIKKLDEWMGNVIKKTYELTHPPVPAGRPQAPHGGGADAFRILHGHAPGAGPSPYGSLPGRGTFGVQQDQGQQQMPASPFGALVGPSVIPSDPGSTTEATAKAQLAVMEQLRELLRRQAGEGPYGAGASPGPGHGQRTLMGESAGGARAIARSKADQTADANLIRRLAKEAGVDPETAVAVARSEGLGTSWAGGDKGTSFGPMQAHFASNIPGLTLPGQGDVMAREGINAKDPAQKEAVLRWQLNYAKKHGWGEWHGAKRVGIGEWQGVHGPWQWPETEPKKTPGPQSSIQIDQHLADLEAIRSKASEPIRTKVAFDFDDSDFHRARTRGGAQARREFSRQVKMATARSFSDVGVG